MTRASAASMLIARPSPRLHQGSSDVGISSGRAGIVGEVFVFTGTSDPALGYAIGKSGDTEGDAGSGGAVTVPD